MFRKPRTEKEKVCPVCENDLDIGSHIECLRSGYQLTDEYPLDYAGISLICFEQGLLTKWGQPSPGRLMVSLADDTELTGTRQEVTESLARLLMKRVGAVSKPEKGSMEEDDDSNN